MSFSTALQMAQIALSAKRHATGLPLKREDIAAQVDELLGMPMFGADIDRDALIRDLEARFTIWSDDPQMLNGDDDHRPWLSARTSDIKWMFWERYRLYLSQSLPPSSIEALDGITSDVLAALEDPLRPGAWDRRGLVMGHVQSGKTASYTGLICKAADAGYKVVIVLAGLHNNLRSQTQMRLDEGFLGYKSVRPGSGAAAFVKTGVGNIDPRPRADSVTNRSDSGDFNRAVASHFGIHPGGNPLLFVVKKNVSVLQNLLAWISSSADRVDPDSQRKYHSNIPLLVIDDEADQASVDVNIMAVDADGNPDEDHNPTRINELIRRLLIAFDKSAYVGYTATPFANIFIHDGAKTRDLGEDLFPRSFILNLPAPSNYTGAGRIFGIRDHGEVGLTESPALPIIRIVSDHAASEARDETSGWMPPKLELKTAHIPLYKGERRVPPSLREAILSFLLSTTVRIIRDPRPQFNSMLVHVVRFTKVQDIVREEVERELAGIVQRLRLGDGGRSPTIIDEIKAIWEDDYLGTSAACGCELPEWPIVEESISRIAQTTKVRTINGTAKDALDYEEHREVGLTLIAVGGDKLSRGLTLEGLTVSYFLRSSKMYDTLMQMGRWFGYRESYLDLCRLFTTDDLVSWFGYIASAVEELRLEFDYMFNSGGAPRDYGLRVRAHPAMLVTSAVKMRSGTSMKLSYSGDISETILFDLGSVLQKNRDAVAGLLGEIGKPSSGKVVGGYIWKGCPVDSVMRFLAAYQSHPDAIRADTRLLSRYIKAQIAQGELTSWTVFLASSGVASSTWKLSEEMGIGRVGLVERRAYPSTQKAGRFSIRRLVNPADELCDLDSGQSEIALSETVRLWQESKKKNKSKTPPETPGGRGIRLTRPKSNGLLIIYPIDGTLAGLSSGTPVMGFAISFPVSETAREIEYTVNNVFTAAGDYDSL
ncbi:MAG: Z1 domain-containing protein [Betaproteobacteria bacterium]|jgi:hypothetical protein